MSVTTTNNGHYCNFEDKNKSLCAQLQLSQLLCLISGKRKENTNIYMKMLNASLLIKAYYKMDLKHTKITKAEGDPNFF